MTTPSKKVKAGKLFIKTRGVILEQMIETPTGMVCEYYYKGLKFGQDTTGNTTRGESLGGLVKGDPWGARK